MNSVLGKLSQMLGTMLLFASNAAPAGDRRAAPLRSTRCRSGTAWQPSSVTEVVTVAFAMFFAAAVQIALPLIGVLFLADLGLALLTRVAPAAERDRDHVPGQDRADPAAGRRVLRGAARRDDAAARDPVPGDGRVRGRLVSGG